MTVTAETHVRPRLLFRVDPIPLESPRGYLCRVASAHGYDSPQWLAHLAGLSGLEAALDREDCIGRIAHLLRLEPEEWLGMCYRNMKGAGGLSQRSFYGKPVGATQLNLSRPRACPGCLRERSVWWAIWDLCLLAVCPIHRCLLVDQCPRCKKTLAWQRPAVHQCRCGLDLRTVTTESADTGLVAINAVTCRAVGFSPGMAAGRDIDHHKFAPELATLSLGSLLTLLRFLRSVQRKDVPNRRRLSPARIDLNVAIEAGHTAVALLANWPHSLRAVLRDMVPGNVQDATDLKFNNIFGSFYFQLFRALPRSQFGFLHDIFEEFVSEDWKGLVRGQHRFFSASTRLKSPWLSLPEATREARTNPRRIEGLVRQGKIEGVFVKLRRGRTQCWVKRDSLTQWVVARDREFARYIPRRETARILGLPDATLLRAAQAGLIRYAWGPEHGLPHGFQFFLREDVIKTKLAFEKHAVPEHEYSKPGELMALRDAIHNYLGREAGLTAAVQAVIDGTLVPVAYTPRFPGITGYLFPSEHLRLYRPLWGDIERPPDGFLNYTEAASRLGSKTPAIRALVELRILSGPTGRQRGCKLVAAADVHRFSNQYVGVRALARHLQVTGCRLARYLRDSGTQVFAVPVGSGERALFLQKEVAAEVRVPPPRKSRRNKYPPGLTPPCRAQ